MRRDRKGVPGRNIHQGEPHSLGHVAAHVGLQGNFGVRGGVFEASGGPGGNLRSVKKKLRRLRGRGTHSGRG